MKPLDCTATRRQLPPFCDHELPVSGQIAVSAHLESCGECRSTAAEFRLLSAALRAAAPGRVRLSSEEAAVFTTTVVECLKAEQQAAFIARARLVFHDLHLVYIGVGAVIAAVACVVGMLSMLRFAADERSDSLAAIVSFLATPGTSGNLAAIDGEVETRWSARFRQAHETAEQDAVFTLSAIVTRDGRLATLDHLRREHRSPSTGDSGSAGPDDARLIETLMDTLVRARFGEMEGSPPASSILWLVARTTVRATKT